jgi:hypothetical protein
MARVMSDNPHCKIGKVSPKLAIVRSDNIIEMDPWDDCGFIEDLIDVARRTDVSAYAFVIAHKDGTISSGSSSTSIRSKFLLIGGLTCELSRFTEKTRKKFMTS